jgi:hypothetical protein
VPARLLTYRPRPVKPVPLLHVAVCEQSYQSNTPVYGEAIAGGANFHPAATAVMKSPLSRHWNESTKVGSTRIG